MTLYRLQAESRMVVLPALCSCLLLLLPTSLTVRLALSIGGFLAVYAVWWWRRARFAHPILELRFNRWCRGGWLVRSDRGRTFRTAWTEVGGDRAAFRAKLGQARDEVRAELRHG